MYSATTLVGYVGRDSELGYSAGEKPYLHFSVAADTGWGDNKKTVWYRCTLFGKRAESLEPYILRGKLLLVTGQLSEPKAFQRRDGTWDAGLEMIVNDVRFLGGKREDKSGPPEELEQEEIPF